MRRAWLAGVLLWSCFSCALAVDATDTGGPVITIIIDDLGFRHEDSWRAVGLPGPVACSVLPHTPHGAKLARAAHAAGKEVMLHLPMQAMSDKDPGPGALMLDDGREMLRRQLQGNLASVPYAVGINNHMGSLLTRHPGHMHWLMEELRSDPRGLFFVDSLTSHQSVAMQLALENGVPTAKRDLFLDRDQSPDAIERQFFRLIELAHERGAAVAIGHPYPETLDLLERELPRLERHGVRLVGVAEFIRRSDLEKASWHASLSPSPKASKN